MLDRHDVVICCASHSEYYAVRLMQKLLEEFSNSLKYNIIAQDSEQSLLAKSKLRSREL